MKLVTLKTASGEQRIGALRNDLQTIVDLKAGAEAIGADTSAFSNMIAMIEAGDSGLETARKIVAAADDDAKGALTPLASVKLCAPVPVPQQMRDFLAFELHYKQARAQALKIRAATYSDPAAAEIQLAATDEFRIPPIWYEQPVYYKGNRFSVIGTDTDILWPKYC